MKPRNHAILALDPGLRDLGYALLAGRELLAAGVLQLRTIPTRRRLGKVGKAMEAWLRGYRPSVIVMEDVPRRPLDKLAGLPALGRLLRRIGARKKLKVHSYSSKAVRLSVVNDGWAGKREVAQTIATLFPELKVHLTQDRKWKVRYWHNMFDAVALALHHQSLNQLPSRSRRSG